MLLQKDRVKSCDKILRGIADLNEPTFKSAHNLMRNFGSAVAQLRETGRQISEFMVAAYGLPVAVPDTPVAGAEVAAKPYEQALADARQLYDGYVGRVAGMFAECPMIGRFDWVNEETARFSYLTVQTERGLTKIKHHRTRHVHDLVRARSHRLTDGISIRDSRAKEMIRMVPASLRPYARVITGLEIVQGQEHAGTEERLTGLGRFFKSVQGGSVAVARGVAASGKEALTAVGLGGALLGVGALGALTLLATAAQVIIADPALVVGEYVLWGWED